jgi:hypothetical protein
VIRYPAALQPVFFCPCGAYPNIKKTAKITHYQKKLRQGPGKRTHGLPRAFWMGLSGCQRGLKTASAGTLKRLRYAPCPGLPEGLNGLAVYGIYPVMADPPCVAWYNPVRLSPAACCGSKGVIRFFALPTGRRPYLRVMAFRAIAARLG